MKAATVNHIENGKEKVEKFPTDIQALERARVLSLTTSDQPIVKLLNGLKSIFHNGNEAPLFAA